MPKLVIKATKFANTPEAREVFDQRGWKPIDDQSTVPANKRLVTKDRLSTPLIDVEMEEWEYGD
jgi:hypothetical protein